jgi:dipeptidase E
MSSRIITVGGGFLLFDARWLQERYILSQLRATPGRKLRVLFVGTAGGDADRSQLNAIKTFTALGCEADALAFFPYDMKRDYVQAVLDADLVYVGGGNTVGMLAVWREFGFDAALRRAYDSGTVLAGISAGANCWFEHFVTDSVPGGGVREGLGFVPGTYCPHLDSEAWRQDVLAACDAPAYGGGEHVLMRFDDGALVEAVHEMPPHLKSPPMCRVRERGDAALRDLEPRDAATATLRGKVKVGLKPTRDEMNER